MTFLRLERFGGEAPKISDRLLPEYGAAEARNARLLSGELRGIKQPDRVHRFSTGPIRNVRRLYKDNGTVVWLGLSAADSDIAKGPLVNDSFDRYYWTGEGAYVSYNSIDRIENGDAAYRLGTPAPATAPTVVVTGGSGESETRAYTYTFINEFGEESAPAPVTQISGFINGSWDLSGLATTAADVASRNPLDAKRIYRTRSEEAHV